MEWVLPVLEAAGGAVAPNRNVLADDLALLPFVVARKDLGDAQLGRTLLLGLRKRGRLRALWLVADEANLSHEGRIKVTNYKFIKSV